MNDQVSIENLTIDDVNYVVADLPEELQGAVRKYEEWRDRFAVAQDEVALVGAALRDLGAQIVAAVRQNEEQEAAAAAAAAETAVEEVPAAATGGETLVVDDA
jgi:hypothetical protein